MKNSVLETHKYDWLPRELELLQVSYLKYEAQKTQKWFATKGTGTSPVSSLEILTGILYGTVTITLWNKDRF